PPQNPSIDSDFDPVFLHNGEFYTAVTDVMLPAGDFDLKFTRIYRSRSAFLGVLGQQWTHNFAERLYLRDTEGERGLTYIDPEGKKYFLRFDVALNRFVAPQGLFVTVLQNENGFVLRHRNGEEHFFNGEGRPAEGEAREWRLQEIRNDKGQIQHCIYNDSGQLVRVDDPLGRPFHFFYRDSGLLERVEDFTGRVWRFDYNDKAELIAATSSGTPAFPKGKTTRYRYDDKHRMTLVMDPKGQIYLQNFYAESGKDAGKIIAQHYGGDAVTTEARYDGLKTWVKDRVGVVHLYEHDEEGHLVQKGIIKPDGVYKMQRRYVYDANGIAAKEIWPSGKVVILSPLASAGQADEAKNPERVQDDRQYQHDPWGNIISAVDAEGNIRKFEVDASNLITKEINNGEERKYFYDANDNIVKMEIPSQNLKLEFEYDMLDRMTAKKEILDGTKAITTRYEYDAKGRLIGVVESMGNDIRYEYDDEGNVVKKDGEHFAYDMDGDVISQTDKLGRITRYEYDASKNVSAVVSPMENKTEYLWNKKGEVIETRYYDADHKLLAAEGTKGRLLFRENPRGGKWIASSLRSALGGVAIPREIDSASRPLAGLLAMTVFDPIGRPVAIDQMKMEWDDNGRLAALVDEGGKNTRYAYDDANRLILEKYPDNTEIRYEYDAAGQQVGRIDRLKRKHRFEYDADGNLVRRSAEGIVQEFAYDGLSRLIEAKENGVIVRFAYDSFSRIVGESVNGRLVSKNYDAADHPTFVQYPSGLKTSRRFDDRGNLLEVFADQKPVVRFQYDEADHLQKIFYANQARLEQTFTEQGWLASQNYQFPNRKDPILWKYEYDAKGKLEAPPLASLNQPGKTERDASGNLLRDEKYVYQYDAFDRLVSVQNEQGKMLEAFAYDPLGRVVKNNGNDFVYDGWNLLEVYENNARTQSVIYGDGLDQPLALYIDTFHYYHTDRLGSVRMLSNHAGEAVQFYDYTPFGSVTARGEAVANHLGYIGRPFFLDGQLLNFRYRYYAPQLGEFITADPLGYKNQQFAASNVFTPRNFSYHNGQGGASRTTFSDFSGQIDIDLFYSRPNKAPPVPETDLFAYAGGDPLNFYDPLGLYKIEVQLPHYGSGRKGNTNFRDQHGILMLRKNNGHPLMGPFRVLGRSSNTWRENGKQVTNPNKNRDPVHEYGDTPTGIYKV
ncbi:MAG: DUF6531 domain-containing protein, partial [Deltaproteobacteria bacterium]|nr:DUF6531 domain-containing protein [Deltaproteobacteria bacterium]